MPTTYTDAVYDANNLGVISNSYFSTSSTSSFFVYVSGGTLQGSPVIGIAYNDADLAAGTALGGSPKRIILSIYNNGVATGDTTTMFTTTVSAAGTIPFAVIGLNRKAVNVALVGGTLTYSVDLSASAYDISDKNFRRLLSLQG